MRLLERSIQALLTRRVLPEREAEAPAPPFHSPARPSAPLGTIREIPEEANPVREPIGLCARLSDELEREDRRYAKPLTL